jgi:hypothetical protein
MTHASSPEWANSPLRNGQDRSVFDDSPLCIVERDLDNRITYANKAAMALIGVQTYHGLTLADVFAEPEAQRILTEQTEDRRKGMFGNYRVEIARIDDPTRKFEIEVTGLPVLDDTGAVAGSIGLFQSRETEQLTKQIRELTLNHTNRRALLNEVAQILKPVLPFDLLLVSRITFTNLGEPSETCESETYFEYPAFEQDIPTVWVRLSPAHADFMSNANVGTYDFE